MRDLFRTGRAVPALLLILSLLIWWSTTGTAGLSSGPSTLPAPEGAQTVTKKSDHLPRAVLAKPRTAPGNLSLFLGYRVLSRESIAGQEILRLEVPAGQEEDVARRLREDPRVEWAEPDYLREVMTVPNDPLYKQFQWNLRKIQAEQAWDISTGSQDVIVAVLDTGVDSSHPDLAGKLLPGYDLLNDNSTPTDDSGHGTHKAGVVGAAANNGVGIAGVSWGARIMPLKVLNSSGVGPDSVIARGITYAVDHGARVINMSFGSANTSQVLASAVSYANDKGTLMVAAAGNTAKLDNSVIYPAAYPQVLAVAATDESDKVADFSQHHPYVGISAPGVRIASTFWRGAGYGSYVSSSGTSDAAPHVSGLAALIWSANPKLSNGDVKQILQDTSIDLGPQGKDEYYGSGRINAYRALLAAKPVAAPTATVPPTVLAPTPAPTVAPAATPASLPRTVWYFAEGSTARPFDLWLLLQNPNSAPATAKITYMKGDGSQSIQLLSMDPLSRQSIFVNELLPDVEVSMKVESDSLLFAERAMYFGHDGHTAVGAAAPSTRWFMAEGSTLNGAESWVLLQNPLDSPANAVVTFLTPTGQRYEVRVFVPATSRRSVLVNQTVPNSEVATMVTSDRPIVAERAMYFGQGGGHGSLASSQTARSWYLADGRVGDGYDSWLLVLNPGQAPANLKVTFMSEEGMSRDEYYVVQPGSRFSLYANGVLPAGAFGAVVESDQAVVVDRSTYFAGGSGGHSVAGTPLLAREWYLPEGSTKPPFTETIAILNPEERHVAVTATFMRNDGFSEVRQFTLGPTSRSTLNLNDLVPDQEISTKIVSDSPIAVERSMLFAGGRGGTSSPGISR